MAFVPATKLLVVAWGGADWQIILPLLEAGRLPALGRLVSTGVMGHLASLAPQVSPLLWTSLVTGKRADKHGVLGHVMPASTAGGLGLVSVEPVDGRLRRSRALWTILSEAGLRGHVVGWPTRPAEAIDGVFVTHLFPLTQGARLPDGVVHPSSAVDALAALRIDPSELTHAHLLPFVPGAAAVDQHRDRRLAGLATMIAECSSLHAVATDLMARGDWRYTVVHYDLLDRVSHVFMAYRAPAHPDVPIADCDTYGDVVTAGYVFADMMLARLLELAGDDSAVVVVSDHGFRSGRWRPATAGRGRGAVNWHRQQGIFVMRGPGVQRDEWIWGASLLDVAPTLLVLLGLPVGADMDGRPLLQAFDERVPVQTIPSWETADSARVVPSRLTAPDAAEARLELVRLVEQGYLDARDTTGDDAAARAAVELSLTEARVHVEADHPHQALPLLRDLHDRHPNVDVYSLELASVLQQLGELDECRRLVEEVIGRGLPSPDMHRLQASLLFAEGRFEHALDHLFLAEQSEPDDVRIHCTIGETYLKLERWEEAERAFLRALDLDEGLARAHHGLAVMCLGRRRWQDAAEAALKAVGLDACRPLAHYHLGVALARLGEVDGATRAFEMCLRLRPGTIDAHRWLARLRARRAGGDEGLR
jgi:predicted AlkP superfamily phosphohydrolase/phosphomutase/Flp pilus assembly protein TadD